MLQMLQMDVVPLLINGEDVAAPPAPVHSPATGQVLYHYANATPDHAAQAVQAASDALSGWRATAPAVRRNLFLKAADVLDARRAELAETMVHETGAPAAWADFNLTTTGDMLRHAAGLAATANCGAAPVTSDPGRVGALVLREPYGVVVGMAPWNAPFILGMRAVVFPLAAGNTVVYKASELAPRCARALAAVLVDAGLPAGVLNVVFSSRANAPTVAERLIAAPAVRKISFTGSTAIGRALGELAGRHLKPVMLELGGKAAAIVCDDADLARAAQQCALGAFLNAGQICMSTERVIVHESVARAFEAELVAAIEAMFGDVGDVASETSAQQTIGADARDKVLGLVDDALGKGACLVGSSAAALDASRTAGGSKLRPLVIKNASSDALLYATESFGPVVCLFEVADDAAAVRLANDVEQGLTAAVFTADLQRGLRLARAIEAGAVHINSMTIHDEMALPHGGVKASGFGRFNVDLAEWTVSKTITYPM